MTDVKTVEKNTRAVNTQNHQKRNAEVVGVIRCSVPWPKPELAGCADVDALQALIKQYPHLRPCPDAKGVSGNWEWVYVTRCVHCRKRRVHSA